MTATASRTRARRVGAWLSLIALVAVLGACSSDDNSPSASASSESSSSTSSSSPDSSSSAPNGGGAAWTTWGGDASRSNATADGPDATGLHLAWKSSMLDGTVYGEPLLVGNSVIVATTGNSVYAFDAATGKPQWQTLHLGDPVDGSTLPCGNVNPLGITSTPVADPANNRLYVVGMMQPNHHELVALDLHTGAEMFRVPVDADGADPDVHNQRGALAFANGHVYVPFGGRFGDCGDYKGRVVSVAADGQGPHGQYAVRANREGGFWGPMGPVLAPDNSLYVTSGNSDSRRDFDDGNAVIHLDGNLQPLDEFAPTDWAQLNAGDVDLGTVMPALLDDGRIFQTGKSGVGYVLDANHLGGVGGELHQEQVCDRVYGGVAHENATVFVPCTNRLRALTVADDHLTDEWSVDFPSPGPPLVANGLVWALDVQSGTLHALDRTSGQEVFNARVGAVTRFSSPTAANHTVYVSGGKTVQAFTSAAATDPGV